MKLELREALDRIGELTEDECIGLRRDIIDAHEVSMTLPASPAAVALTQLDEASKLVAWRMGRLESERAAVTASAAPSGTVARMAARQGRPTPSPEAASTRNRSALVASGNLRGVAPMSSLERDDLALGLSETLLAMPRSGPPRGDVVVARIDYAYPEDRKLGNDPAENARKMESVTGRDALVATGGICAPVNVDYTVGTWATADRPLRDGLPAFQATRGGITFVQPQNIGAWAGATGIWTEATDANPAGATKPIMLMSCATNETVYLEAVTTRLGFGNMQSRFAPEQMAAAVDNATSIAARIAENNLLNLIAATAVADVTSATLLGATRDLLVVLDQATAGYRSVNRLPRSQSITVIFPDWVKDLLRADLSRETAHQQDSSWNSLAVSDEQLEDLLAARGVNAIFHLDGQSAAGTGGATYPAQTFATQATGPINMFPTKVVWYMFGEGMVQFLDGGRLDLGVVRGSTLDASNDFELFVETFKSVANRGFANGVYQMVTSLCANGSSAGTVSTAGDCA